MSRSLGARRAVEISFSQRVIVIDEEVSIAYKPLSPSSIN